MVTAELVSWGQFHQRTNSILGKASPLGPHQVMLGAGESEGFGPRQVFYSRRWEVPLLQSSEEGVKHGTGAFDAAFVVCYVFVLYI